jgi:thiamine-phosphate pyrophosphorylase
VTTGQLPELIVITDWSLGEERVLSALEKVLALGPRVAVQHRNPGASTRVFFEQARKLGALCRSAGAPLFVNGRLDVALAIGAHLHLPAHGPLAADVRPFLPAGTWLSAAVHDRREAEDARGADLALVSPVFGALSKPEDTRAPLGPGGFSELASRLDCPAYALGGMTPETVSSLRGRCAGVASVNGVLAAQNALEAARALMGGEAK